MMSGELDECDLRSYEEFTTKERPVDAAERVTVERFIASAASFVFFVSARK
jgi:hypothetical protein